MADGLQNLRPKAAAAAQLSAAVLTYQECSAKFRRAIRKLENALACGFG
jgi:hypothetical protein